MWGASLPRSRWFARTGRRPTLSPARAWRIDQARTPRR
ncbi:MAG: hypothetical protein ACFCVF_09890 [Kineosporiaceae bacterium]